jgi:type I restriction enzyme, S subunit
MPPDMVPLAGLGVLVGQRTEKASGRKNPEWPYLGLEHLDSGSPFLNGKAPSSASTSTNNVFYRGDVLFGKLRPYLRKSVGAPFCGYCSTDILVLQAGEGVDPGYAAKIFQSDAVFSRANATAIGTKMPRTSWGSLRSLEVFSPPLPEQRRIAEILDTLDKAIRRTEQVISKLQQMKQGLLHDLLTRGVDESGELRDPERHPEQFKDSPLGRIPRDWEVLSALSVASKEPGSTTIGPFGSNLKADDYQPYGVPVVFVRDIRDTGFEWISNVYVTDSKAVALSAHGVLPGDVLATKMGLPPCISATYPSSMTPGIITADIVRLRPDTNVASSVWLATYLNSPRVRLQVRAITGGVTRPKITLADFRYLQLAVPPLAEQGRLLHLLEEVDIRVQREHDDARKLRYLKQGLMDDVLTGRARVSVESEVAAA